ncbi:HPP family protein [Acuticoccus sp. M5D2P5]|uniref:HPP family protein n=1 Tax=Acuticoccus kalidii TaxID=2910977 RepID=UPI001F28EA03|nr:HPP family protein [Acuticoccus kalidii]MCF3934883.1 HPP family protein [Acuticoccus kalidii]
MPAFRNLSAIGRALLPALPAPSPAETWRAPLGACVGLTLCALCVLAMQAAHGGLWFLVAPLGASAVLLFAVPNSPLAQPWSAVVGNTVSAVVAVAVLQVVPPPFDFGIAVGGAIAAMMITRSLHPPGGAVALLAVIEAETVREIGILFALVPVGATTTLLVLSAIVYNRLTGRVYPFRQPHSQPGAERRLGLSSEELGAILGRFNQASNVGVADLARLLAAAEHEAAAHRFDQTRCADLMTKDLITVSAETPLTRAVWLFQKHAIKSLPVVGADGALLGILLQGDLIEALTLGRPVRRSPNARRLRRPLRDLLAEDAMQDAATTVTEDTPVGALLNRLASQAVQVVPVMRGPKVVGIITRSDIIGLLLRGSAERKAA